MVTKEESERVEPTAAESQKFDEVASEKQASSTDAEGGFRMREVEEQQAVRVEIQIPKRRAAIHVESEETQGYALERRGGGGDWLCAECGKCSASSTLVRQGGEAHTINLCKRCYNERLVR